MENKILPTKNNLIAVKRTLTLAKEGRDLMDKKKSVLASQAEKRREETKKMREKTDALFKDAYRALKTSYAENGEECLHAVLSLPADDSIRLLKRSVGGQETFEAAPRDPVRSMPYSPIKTSKTFDRAFLLWREALDCAVQTALKEELLRRIEKELQKSRKRVNALDGIVIPELEATLNFISSYLEEKEREDFSRLKLVKDIKTKKDNLKAP